MEGVLAPIFLYVYLEIDWNCQFISNLHHASFRQGKRSIAEEGQCSTWATKAVVKIRISSSRSCPQGWSYADSGSMPFIWFARWAGLKTLFYSANFTQKDFCISLRHLKTSLMDFMGTSVLILFTKLGFNNLVTRSGLVSNQHSSWKTWRNESFVACITFTYCSHGRLVFSLNFIHLFHCVFPFLIGKVFELWLDWIVLRNTWLFLYLSIFSGKCENTCLNLLTWSSSILTSPLNY